MGEMFALVVAGTLGLFEPAGALQAPVAGRQPPASGS